MRWLNVIERRVPAHFRRAWLISAVVCCVAASNTVAEDVVVYSTRSDNHVHIVAAADLTPITKFDAQIGAHELAISPDGRWIVGSAYGGPGAGHQPPDKRLAIIDTKSRSVHRIVDLGVERPNDIAFRANATEAIVTVEAPPRLIRIDPESGEFKQIHLQHQAGHMLALHPSGKYAYVAHVMPGSVSVVNLESGNVASIDTPTAVSFPGASEVRLFDSAAPDRLVRVSLKRDANAEPVQPTNIAFSADGMSLAVVCDGKNPELVRIDAREGKVTHRAPTAPTPDELASGTI